MVHYSLRVEQWTMRWWFVMGRPLYFCSGYESHGATHHVLGTFHYARQLLPYLAKINETYVSSVVISELRKSGLYKYAKISESTRAEM